MTATIERPKSILITSRQGSHHGSSIRSPLATRGNTAGQKRSVVSAEKPRLLKNMRSYYARRRPTMLTPIAAVVVSPERVRKIRFREENTVREIPSHKDFSKVEKKTIWTSRAELKRLMLKNHAEYVWEGRDWRNAPEEDQFSLDEEGKLVHPLHAKKKVTKKNLVLKKRRTCCRMRKLPMAQVVSSDSSSDEDDDERENKRPRRSV